MHHLNIDIETFSSVDLLSAGLYKYAQSPDFEILLFAYSLDGAPVEVIDFTAGEQIPPDIKRHLYHPDTTKHAYNAAFEWFCLEQYLSGNPSKPCTAWLNQWQDTMLHALYCGYPASLAAAGKAIGLAEEKKKLTSGRMLIKTFCTPRKPTAKDKRTRIRPTEEPEKWKLFKEYNAQDVVTEMEIEQKLSDFPVPADVQADWVQDLVINSRGVAVDMDIVNGALNCHDTATARLTEEAVKISGLDNPNSISQLTAWINTEISENITDLKKQTVADLLNSDIGSDNARRMLEIRQELGKTSVKKYTAMQSAVCDDGRIRGLLQFYGANRTGRWAGRLVQVQNLPRTYLHGYQLDTARQWVREQKVEHIDKIIGSVPDVLSQLIRTAFIPAEGNVFIDADFSAIEARVIAWLAGEEWVLDVFRTHGKIYEACAAQMFGVPLEKISRGNSEYELRQRGKVATLALGYQGGTGALVQMGALRQGISEDDLPDIVRRWREANRRIVDLWYAVEAAALDTIKTGRPNAVRELVFTIEGNTERYFLTIKLPSGRKLYYCHPYLIPGKFNREAIRYMGQNQTTKRWEPIDTYGGKLVENCVQAIARDCLSVNINRLEEQGYDIVFHVHDEVVIDCQLTTDANTELSKVCNIISQPIEWAPGLPLNADGWVGDYYTKD